VTYLPGHLDAYLEAPYTQAGEEPPRELSTRKHAPTRQPLAPGEERIEVLPGVDATLVTTGEPRPCRACLQLHTAFVNRRGVTVCLECDGLPEVPW
jgi:hypothetical protein